MNHFITSNGIKINFVKGWYEAKSVWPYQINSIKEFSERVFTGNPQYPTGPKFFVNKLTAFNYFYEFISENLVNEPKLWRKALDIGTGPAIQPRLMKGAGLCEEVWGIDIADRCSEFNDTLPPLYIDAFKNKMAAANESVINTVRRRSIGLSFNFPLHVPYSLFSVKSDYSLDRYIVADFMQHDFGSETFDIITGLWVIEYFDPKTMFEKIHSLLNPGGLFFVIVDYWYEVCGSSMNLPMDAPWLHARVTRDDLIRYYDKVRPDIAPYAKKCVYFAESHLTPVDYATRASAAGLNTLSYRRGIIPDIILPTTTGRAGNYFYSEILLQARLINPNVTASDLLTYYLTMLFVKE